MADLLESFLEFWVDVILLVPRLIFWSSLQLLEFAISAVTSMFGFDPQEAAALADALPADVLYFTTMFQLHIGLPWLCAALLSRFVLRRIPFIG